jgi:hypothetical protein
MVSEAEADASRCIDAISLKNPNDMHCWSYRCIFSYLEHAVTRHAPAVKL